MDGNREDLLQRLIEGMMSVMRHIGRGQVSGAPALSPPQGHILHIIAGHDNGVTVTELAEEMGITPGAVTQFVDGLVEKDMVGREGDPGDRRVVRLKLTADARAQYEQLRKAFLASVTRVFGVLTDDELRELVRIFTRVKDSQGGKTK